MRYEVSRGRALNDGVFFSNVVRKEGEFQVKWAGEEGLGGGPTREFHSQFMEDIQRSEIGLWRDENSRGSMTSMARLLNGGEESPAGRSGVLRCGRCRCLHLWKCVDDHCLLSINRRARENFPRFFHRPIVLQTVWFLCGGEGVCV